MLLSTAATTLLAIDEIGAANLGVVLDFGHSLFAKESPTSALEMVHRRGRLVSVELNDNRLEWDDDLTVGSNHLIETIEFLLATRRIGWDRPLLLDQFPFPRGPRRRSPAQHRHARSYATPHRRIGRRVAASGPAIET